MMFSAVATMMVVGMLAGTILWFAYHLLFAFAAYHDARSKENQDALLWALLIGFLGLIPGIIYLCVRNSGRKYIRCPNCGCMHYAWEPHCPQCGLKAEPGFMPSDPYAGIYAEKAKREMIAGIIVAVGGTALFLLWAMFRFFIFFN
jgi:hypothetical protein